MNCILSFQGHESGTGPTAFVKPRIVLFHDAHLDREVILDLESLLARFDFHQALSVTALVPNSQIQRSLQSLLP